MIDDRKYIKLLKKYYPIKDITIYIDNIEYKFINIDNNHYSILGIKDDKIVRLNKRIMRFFECEISVIDLLNDIGISLRDKDLDFFKAFLDSKKEIKIYVNNNLIFNNKMLKGLVDEYNNILLKEKKEMKKSPTEYARKRLEDINEILRNNLKVYKN